MAYSKPCGVEDRCLQVPLSVAVFLKMPAKRVATRATTATRAGCSKRDGLGKALFEAQQHFCPDGDPKLNILQLNTQGLTAENTNVIEQLAYKDKAFIFVPQETHCTCADKLVIPTFSLPGSGSTVWPRLFTSGWNVHWSTSLQSNQRLSGCA